MNAQHIRSRGFTLVEIMIVVSMIGLLAGIAIPSMMRSRTQAQKNGCIENLRQIDGAKQQWAMEKSQGSDVTPVDADLQPYLNRNGSGLMPICPAGSVGSTFDQTYTIKTVGENPECLIVPATHVLPP